MLSRLAGKLYEIDLIGNYPKNYKPTISKHGTIDDTNLSQNLKSKIGARVMIVINVNTADSLVNGALGTIIDIITKEDTVNCVVIRFDSEKVGMEQRRNHANIADKYKDSNGTPIFRQKLKYFLNSCTGQAHAVQATVFQFPIKVAFAITGHKMQVMISVILLLH